MGYERVPDRDYGPIFKLEDGEELLVTVKGVRETGGQYPGHVIDCIDWRGVAFSLNAPVILADKVERTLGSRPTPYLIKREGAVGRAQMFEVSPWTGSDAEFQADKGSKKMVVTSQEFIDLKIAEIPPK